MIRKSALSEKIAQVNREMAAAVLTPNRAVAMKKVLFSSDCYLVACALAARYVITQNGYTKRESAHNLAMDVLDSLFANPGKFQGRSKFTTYLCGALRQSRSQGLSKKIPDAIKGHHYLAPMVYELLLRDNWKDQDIYAYLSSVMPSEKAHELVAAVHKVIAKDPVYHGSRFGVSTFSALEAEDGDDFQARFPDSKDIAPLEAMVSDDQRRIIQKIVGRLAPAQRKLVKAYVMKCTIKTYKQASIVLGIKNPAYELEKAKENLRDFLKEYD